MPENQPSAVIVGALLLTDSAIRDIPFYSQILGWETAVSGTAVSIGGEPVAVSVVEAPEDLGWVPEVAVPDVPSLLKRAEASGYSVELHNDWYLLGTGQEVVAVTTERRPSAAYRPVDQRTGHLSWLQLNSRAPRASADVYSTLFGWELHQSQNDKFTYWQFHADGQEHAGLMGIDERSGLHVVPGWQCYFRVEAAAAAQTEIERLDCMILHPFTQIVPGEFVVARDVGGHLVAFDRMTPTPRMDSSRGQ